MLKRKPSALKPMADLWRIDPEQPDADIIAQAARIIKRGGVVVMPTSGLYGLGANAFNADAVQRIINIKGRPVNKAVLVLVNAFSDLDKVAQTPNKMAKHMMHHFWPGGVTFVVYAQPELPHVITGGGGKVGVRWVAHRVAAALIRTVGGVLTGTSANPSGAAGCASVARIDARLLGKVDGVLDAGQLSGGAGSTVVDVTGRAPKILREGIVAGHEIMNCFDAWLASNRP